MTIYVRWLCVYVCSVIYSGSCVCVYLDIVRTADDVGDQYPFVITSEWVLECETVTGHIC